MIAATEDTRTLDLVDIGANLTHDSFDADRDDVIENARLAGVTRMILTGSTAENSLQAVELARRYPSRLYATAGVHPHHADHFTVETASALASLLEHEEVVAVGECGLDYFRNFSTPENQRQAFQVQLDLAAQTGLPVFLHQRDAHDDFISLLKPYLDRISHAVAHCFTGNREMLRTYVDLGLYIGITGWICDERRGAHLQEIIGIVPEDRLMIETDAPYLLPRTLSPRPKSRRNEPKYLPEVLRQVAVSRGQPECAVARSTTANAERFFGI
jgi:TatD DNase family protein